MCDTVNTVRGTEGVMVQPFPVITRNDLPTHPAPAPAPYMTRCSTIGIGQSQWRAFYLALALM